MYDDIELLEYLYQNVKINQEIIGQIIKLNRVEENLKNILKEHLKNYIKITNSVKTMLQRRKKEVKDIGVISKMATYMNVKTNLSKKSDSKEIKILVIQGSKISIEEINKKLKEFKIKSKSIINLAERLIMFENEFVNKFEK